MKPNKKEETICLFSLMAVFMFYLAAMAFVIANYNMEPVNKEFILRGRIRGGFRGRGTARVRMGRNTRFLFK